MIHLIGYGNPGRGDDGLGPALARRFDEANTVGLNISIDYQLTVDHAQLIMNADWALFVDASMTADKPYTITKVVPDFGHDLTSHNLTPGAVIALCNALFARSPPALAVGITGYQFGNIREGLSEPALDNLAHAEKWLREWLAQLEPEEVIRERSDQCTQNAGAGTLRAHAHG